MDNDQEVVREPFEDQRDDCESPFSSSSHQPRYDEAQTETMDQEDVQEMKMSTSGSHIANDDQNARYDHGEDNNYDDDDDGSSIASAGDVEFAKSYGIKLSGSKSQMAYERLMESAHFKSAKLTDSRANIANKMDHQAPKPVLKSSVTSDCIYHKGTFYQKGDIVAMYDQDDGQIYFAQLRGFLQDQYCEKSASVNWLVPIRATSRDFFDPSAYTIGLEDVQLRKLDCMTFVRHCPHDYYLRKFFQTPSSLINRLDKDDLQTAECSSRQTGCDQSSSKGSLLLSSSITSSSSSSSTSKDQGYIWTTMETCQVPTIPVNKRRK